MLTILNNRKMFKPRQWTTTAKTRSINFGHKSVIEWSLLSRSIDWFLKLAWVGTDFKQFPHSNQQTQCTFIWQCLAYLRFHLYVSICLMGSMIKAKNPKLIFALIIRRWPRQTNVDIINATCTHEYSVWPSHPAKSTWLNAKMPDYHTMCKK